MTKLHEVVQNIQSGTLKDNIPEIKVGDLVRIGVAIQEGNKERVQPFEGLSLSLYIWLIIIWNLGQGFNEFNLEKGEIRIFRWGFPGKNRRIDLQYSIDDVQSIRVDIQEGLNPKRVIYLKLRGNREIPLTRAGQPISLQELENQAAELARVLQVSLEGI
eukprot:jgi/Picsp_1/3784/NSC_06619-R1_photosystem i assembly protein ycf4